MTNHDLPHTADCQIWFPIQNSGHGLVIELTRLNVPCSRGFVHFSGLNMTQHPYIENTLGEYIVNISLIHSVIKLELRVQN